MLCMKYLTILFQTFIDLHDSEEMLTKTDSRCFWRFPRNVFEELRELLKYKNPRLKKSTLFAKIKLPRCNQNFPIAVFQLCMVLESIWAWSQVTTGSSSLLYRSQMLLLRYSFAPFSQKHTLIVFRETQKQGYHNFLKHKIVLFRNLDLHTNAKISWNTKSFHFAISIYMCIVTTGARTWFGNPDSGIRQRN